MPERSERNGYKDDQECRRRDHTSLWKCGKKSACGNSGALRGRNNGDWSHRLWCTGNGSEGIAKRPGKTWR